MNAVADHSPRWSKRRWLLTVVTLALAQTALVLALSRRTLPPPRAAAPQPDMRVLEPVGSRPLAATPGTDPTLFALINQRGFSGAGWMQLNFAAHELRDWQDESRWLALDPGRFGAEFRKLAANTGTDRLSLRDKPPPRDTVPAIAPPPARDQTGWQFSRELRERPLLTPVKLPAWPHTDVLGRTVLELAVNASGDVLSSRVLRSCGLAAADTYAMQAFEQVRFQPLPRVAPNNSPLAKATVTLGTVTIVWWTREPDARTPAAP
jgi:TonB family protein